MDNLVLKALGNAEVEKIVKIKRNKEFLRKFIGDLQQVYTLYVSNEDGREYSKFSIKKFSNYIPTLFFTAKENGVTFYTDILGYKKEIGWIVEKYPESISDASEHGHIKVHINFTDASPNLMEIIKDITCILDHERVNKNY